MVKQLSMCLSPSCSTHKCAWIQTISRQNGFSKTLLLNLGLSQPAHVDKHKVVDAHHSKEVEAVIFVVKEQGNHKAVTLPGIPWLLAHINCDKGQ
eukprot:6264284-Amphidinium_carterae.2